MRNWGLVFVGNFIGAFTVAVLMIVVTYGFSVPPNEVGAAIGAIGEGRTIGYAEHGAAGGRQLSTQSHQLVKRARL